MHVFKTQEETRDPEGNPEETDAGWTPETCSPRARTVHFLPNTDNYSNTDERVKL